MRFTLLAMLSLLLQPATQSSLQFLPFAGNPSTDEVALKKSAWYAQASRVLEGPGQSQASFGASLASAGDVNGDGYSDVLIGAPLFDGAYTDEGRVYLYYGSNHGLPVTPSLVLSYHCNAGGKEHFGSAVASAGDLNKDGYSDIIIGASEAGSNWRQPGQGQVLVYYGSPAGLKSKADKILQGESPGAAFGAAVANGGDVNGDGYSDIVVGAPGYDNEKGRIYVYYGAAAGLSGTPGTWVQGTNPGAQFGKIVAGAGDVDGDGYSDVVVSAPRFRINAPGDGAVFFYNGAAGGLHTYGVSLINAQNGWSTGFGQWLAAGTDINGDGHPDLVISQPGYKKQMVKDSRLLIYYGTAQGLVLIPVVIDSTAQNGIVITGPVAAVGDADGDGYADIIVAGCMRDKTTGIMTNKLLRYHGQPNRYNDTAFTVIDELSNTAVTLSGAGDVNGDGLADLMTGDPAHSGHARVYPGEQDSLHDTPPGVTLASPDVTVAGFGKSLTYAGDINGDGFSDVIIGDPNAIKGSNNYRGTAYVYYGSLNGIPTLPQDSLLDNQPNCKFGWSVAGAGDINGDGYADVAVSAIRYNGDEGRVFIYYGSPAGLSKTPAILSGGQPGTYLGYSVAGAGDVNGDGYDDVLVSAYNDIVTIDTGKVLVYYGSHSGLLPAPSLILQGVNEPGLAGFGRSLASAGDVNGDGFADVIVGAWANLGGRAFIYLGGAVGLSPVPATILGLDGALPGSFVSGAGDINGDGYSDVLVSADFRESYVGGTSMSLFTGSATGISTTPSGTLTSALPDLHISNATISGDVNGDGYDDVLMTTDGNFGRGMVLMYKGAATGLLKIPDTLRNHVDEWGSLFGYSVGTAGDINGDGYADILVGELFGGGTFGATYLFYGNGGKGYRNNARLYNTDLSTPLSQSNMTNPNIGAGLFAKSPLGKQKARLVWETSESGNPFTGSPVTNSTAFTGKQTTFSNLGPTGVELKNLVAKTDKVTHVRTRVEYDLTTALTGQHYGPWRYPLSEARSLIKPAPDPLDILTFSAEKKYKDVLLKWTAAFKPNVIYTVERSTGNNHFVALYKTSSRPNITEYRWLDEHPQQGKNYYRIKASSGKQQKYSKTVLVEFGKPSVCIVYPNPVYTGQTLYIRLSPAAGKMVIRLLDNNGREVLQKQVNTDSEWVGIHIPSVPMGHYKLVIRTTDETITKNILILRH